MGRRRALVVAGAVAAIVVALAAVLAYRSAHRAPTDCDTVHALLDYNRTFRDQADAARGADGAEPTSEEQYRQWATRLKEYASDISEPTLSGNATTAADLAGRLADLVPKYRAKPDDAGLTREYAGIGIEFGNAINRLEYSCLNPG